MRKRQLHIFACVTAAVVLFAGISGAQPVEIDIIAAGDVTNWIQRNVAAFNAIYDREVIVNVKTIWGEEYVEELTLMGAANVSYDVVQVNPGRNFHVFARNGLFLDLEPFIQRSGFDVAQIYPESLKNAQIDGRTYALAFAAHPGEAGVFYNTAHFDRMGIAPPDPDWTFDDFAEIAFRLTERTTDTGEPTVYGLKIPSYEAIAAAFGGLIVDGTWTEVVPNREGALMALDWLVNAHNRNVLTNESLTAGRAAMEINGPWFGIGVRQSLVADSWDVAHFPIGPEGRITALAAWDGFAIPRTSKNPDVAWDFIRFMLSEAALIDYAAMGGNPVANIQVNLIPDLLGMTGREVFIRALEAGQYVFSSPQEIQSMQQTYAGFTGPLLSGQMSPVEALDAMAREAALILERLNGGQ